MNVNFVRGKFDYKMFARLAIFSFIVFNAIILLLFVGVFGLSFEKLISSPSLILVFAPVVNAVVNTYVNRRTTLTVSNYTNLAELKKRSEELLEISGFEKIENTAESSFWQFKSRKKRIIHLHNGNLSVELFADRLELTSQKYLIEAFVPWLKKVRADEINRGASS